jgi:hypothetical protein
LKNISPVSYELCLMAMREYVRNVGEYWWAMIWVHWYFLWWSEHGFIVCCRYAGGLGEAVATAIARESGIVLTKLAVTGVPRSGQCDELLNMFGISAKCITNAVKEILRA